MLMILRRCRFPTLHRCGAGHETSCRHTILCPALHSLDSYALLFQPIVALLTGCSQQARVSLRCDTYALLVDGCLFFYSLLQCRQHICSFRIAHVLRARETNDYQHLPKPCEYHMYYIELFSREYIVVSKVYHIFPQLLEVLLYPLL